MDSAEQAALSGSSRGAEAPAYLDARRLNVFAPDGRLAEGARRLPLSPSRHFDHLSVNATRSAILMPPFVDEYDAEVQNQIAWSEHLDPLFANNYESDPALSWQYYGSSSGFVRRYPAISWPPEDGRSHHARDLYDFRSSSWFVEAATSPKDIVILLDWSASASGAKGALARATAAAILDTLTPNDFVNIFRFNDVTEELIPCFKNMLVQASPENVRELKYALDSNTPEPSNEANFTAALTLAFEILHRYNRTGLGCQCNQAAMLIAGGATGAPRDVFRTHNWPHMPVRVFTYLAGSDAPGAPHMQWIACSNKGFYVRINDYKEIKEKVFNYVSIMARPMVMYQADHPIHWSPAYIGGRGSGLADDGQGQLMTSVTTPIFDRRNHTQREANLLGVVGTDVPIDQIKKLVPPYKLGVNGYSFIVNNNGHVLYHPDLRPLYNNEEYSETLRPLYSNVDLTELELSEQESTPRENHSLLMDLRNEMIEQKEGETEVAIKVHYEEMRRISTRRQKYFYSPIDGTPFSLAVVLPDGYGMYELLAEQEIRHHPVNVTEYFKGENWKVHPDWVYCEYNSASEISFRTPEERVIHFLIKAGRPGWKWMSLRPRSPARENSHHHFKKQEKDSYYCDKTLLQSLVRDAMVTDGLSSALQTGHKQQGFKMFGVTLSFVATRSGLFKWTDHAPLSSDSPDPHFSEIYQRAFDSPWYKRAVDHHAVEPESFVYSVPFKEPGAADGSDPLVLATHAIFVEHRGHRAPAAVVGLHFQLSTLAKHFYNVTSGCAGPGNCKKNCASQDLDCYILDDNGFVILSEETSHTGQFFGQIDGTIMDSLVQDRIYRKVPLFDYQGRCPNGKNPYSAKGNRLCPISPVNWLLKWLWKSVTLLFPLWDTVQSRAHPYADDDANYPAYGDYEDQEEQQETYSSIDEIPRVGLGPGATTSNPWLAAGPGSVPGQGPVGPGSNSVPPPPGPIAPPLPPGATAGIRACDKRTDLYMLQADRLNLSQPLKGKLTNCHVTGCERPFSVQKIPHSNLILLVVDTLCPCGAKQLGTGARELTSSGSCRFPNSLFRRRPQKCINYHPEEIEIQLCGAGNMVTIPNIIIAIALPFLMLIT